MSKQELIRVFDSEIAAEINTGLAETILDLAEDSFNKRSHFFYGRYENLYLDTSVHPGLTIIVEQAIVRAAELLQLPKQKLQLGFWLNIMNKGDITTLHSHDDDDELLSAVYYVQVPENSGVFKLHAEGEMTSIEPATGRFMFFDPALPHEVGVHNSDIPRISIGINIGENR